MCSRCLSNANSSLYVLKEALFCSDSFEMDQDMFTRCDLYHTILLYYYYAETKEMLHGSVNLKGVVYEPKQNSFSFQSINTCTDVAVVGPIFYKVHPLSSEQVFS